MAQPPPPSTPSPATRRIRVRRRRTPLRLLRYLLFRLLALLVNLGIMSTLHPRYLTPSLIRSLPLASPLSPPRLHLSPSSHFIRTLLYWTPVESVSLLSLPSAAAATHTLLPASPSQRTLYLSDNASVPLALALLQHGLPPERPALLTNPAGFPVPRFAAVSIASVAEEATLPPIQLLEHADGFSAFAALHSALLGTLATGDPWLPFSALVDEVLFAARYVAGLQHPRPLAAVIRGGRAVFGAVDGVLEGVRRLADRKKMRRRRKEGSVAPGVQAQAAEGS